MKTLIVIVASIVVVGCAIGPDPGEPREYKTYRTGSNIPVRDGDSSGTKSWKVDPSQMPPNTKGSPNQTGG